MNYILVNNAKIQLFWLRYFFILEKTNNVHLIGTIEHYLFFNDPVKSLDITELRMLQNSFPMFSS